MKKFNLNTDNKDEQAVINSIIDLGVKSDFWKIILQAIEESKEHLDKRDDDDLRNLPAEQYKFECEAIKIKKKFLDKLAELPETIKGNIEGGEGTLIELDPYK